MWWFWLSFVTGLLLVVVVPIVCLICCCYGCITCCRMKPKAAPLTPIQGAVYAPPQR